MNPGTSAETHQTPPGGGDRTKQKVLCVCVAGGLQERNRKILAAVTESTVYLHASSFLLLSYHCVVAQRDVNMLAVSHLTPELVMGQCKQPLQVLCDEFGMFQKLLHLSRRAVFWWGLVRHKTAFLLPYRVLMLNR